MWQTIYYVEAKTDYAGLRTSNLAIEILRDSETGEKGWAYAPLPTLFVFGLADKNGELVKAFAIRATALRSLVFQPFPDKEAAKANWWRNQVAYDSHYDRHPLVYCMPTEALLALDKSQRAVFHKENGIWLLGME